MVPYFLSVGDLSSSPFSYPSSSLWCVNYRSGKANGQRRVREEDRTRLPEDYYLGFPRRYRLTCSLSVHRLRHPGRLLLGGGGERGEGGRVGKEREGMVAVSPRRAEEGAIGRNDGAIFRSLGGGPVSQSWVRWRTEKRRGSLRSIWK